MSRKRALVTNTIYDAGLDAAHSLAEAGFDIFTADLQSLPLGARSRYAQSNSILSGQDQECFESDLVDLVRRLQPDVFVPLGTRFAYTATRHQNTLAAVTAVNVPPLETFLAAYVKSRCLAECREWGIPCPRAYSFEEAVAVLESAPGTLLVVKPDLDAGAANGVRMVSDASSLQQAITACWQRFGRVLIEEYIPGGAEAMKTAILLYSPCNTLVAAFTMRKIRHWPSTGGPTAVGVSTAEPELVEMVEPLFRRWRWRGPAEVEFKWDARDGRHKVIEINPRLPGYLRLPRCCGLDFVRLNAHLALGDGPETPLPFPSYRTGVRYLSPGLFARTVAHGIRERGVRELRAAFRDARDAASGAFGLFHDPLPAFARILSDFCGEQEPQPLFSIGIPLECWRAPSSQTEPNS